MKNKKYFYFVWEKVHPGKFQNLVFFVFQFYDFLKFYELEFFKLLT